MSQINAAALAAATEQLALVAPLGQGPDDPRAPRLWMTAVLLQDEGELLADEFRARHTPLARRTRQ